jgi:protein SCO1/2
VSFGHQQSHEDTKVRNPSLFRVFAFRVFAFRVFAFRVFAFRVFVIAAAGCGASCAHHYSTTGLVLKVDQPSRVTISHDAFPGYMDAMVMPFDLKGDARNEKLVTLVAGDRVKFRLAVKGDRSWVDRVEVISAAPVDAGLQQTPAVPVVVPVGSPLPDFALVDQANRRVALSSLKGKVVAVTFIYTRCPLPDYCPRMVTNFRAVRDRFAARMDRDLVLLTISFDPTFDTPETLARYAASQRAGGPGWHFLTGESADIERVCNAFGIQYWPEEGMITHSLQTAVIDRDGRLAATVEGKEFTPTQLGDLVETVLAR